MADDHCPMSPAYLHLFTCRVPGSFHTSGTVCVPAACFRLPAAVVTLFSLLGFAAALFAAGTLMVYSIPNEPPRLAAPCRRRRLFRAMPWIGFAPLPPPPAAHPGRDRRRRRLLELKSAPPSPSTATSSTSTTATSAPRPAPCRMPCGAIWNTATWGRITPWSPCWNARWRPCAAGSRRPPAAIPKRSPSRATPANRWKTRSTASISSPATKSSPPTRTIRACSPPSRSASAAKASS